MTCPACGTENPTGFQFCGACAAPLGALHCPACAAAVAPGQRFCGRCGSAVAGPDEATVASEVAPATGERRVATVVFADVVGFTTLAETADPELVAAAVSAGFRRLGDIVREHGGTVNRYIGDCLMAVFGVPVAHEDDPERAVAAALAIRDAAGELTYSIGVNTGEVMVTAMPGDERVTVIGDAVNVAARLQSAAGAREVLVGPLTARLAAGAIRLREREALRLRGRTEPVTVFEALGLDDGDAPTDIDATPLVGRDAELAFLLARWRRCVAERRAELVLVVGDVGTGKSRLVAELAAASGGRAVTVTYPAWGALAGARVVAGLVDSLGPTGDTRLDSRLRSLAGDAVPEMSGLDPASVQREQRRALRRLLELRAAETPLLICIDEAQRAPARTLEVIEELAVRVDGPVLLLAAGRPDPAAWLQHFPAATCVRLDPLEQASAARLAAALVPEGTLSPAAAAALAEHGAGNPLHLRELVRLVRDRDGLVGAGAELGLRGGLSLPPSLGAVLTARLDALPVAARAVAQHVAVLGDGATTETLQALAGTAPEPGVRALVAAGIARHRDDGVVELQDPLLREVAYELLPRRTRADLHRRAAALARKEDERARHLEAALVYDPADASLRAEAGAALEAAGEHLAAIHRPADAADALTRAVALGATTPATVLRLAATLTAVGRDREALAALDALDESAATPRQIAEHLHEEANALTRLDPLEAITRYDQVRRLWAEIGDPTKEAWALANGAVAATYAGQVGPAIELMTDALARFEVLGDRVGIGAARPLLGMLLPDDPRVPTWMEESLAWAREDGDPVREHFALMSAGWWHVFRARPGGLDDVAAALVCGTQLGELGRDLGDVTAEVVGRAWVVLLRRLAGDLEGARAAVVPLVALRPEEDSGFGALRVAAMYAVALLDDPGAPPPAAARTPRDAVGLFAAQNVVEVLVLADRCTEAAELLAAWDDQGIRLPAVHLAGRGIAEALTRLLAGAPAEAASRLVAAVETARLSQAGPLVAMAQALLAEATALSGDGAGAEQFFDGIPSPRPGGVAGAVITRAAAVLGHPGAFAELRTEADRLAAPGLLHGLDAGSRQA